MSSPSKTGISPTRDDFVLEKSIFSNIFEKDIRRVFIYKKAERLAKGLHLIIPAFRDSLSLRRRLDDIAVALIDAALLHPNALREALSRELLTLSSILAIARTSGVLSPMNADLVSREAQLLLQEIAAYEERHLELDEHLTLSAIAKGALPAQLSLRTKSSSIHKGHIKDISRPGDRRERVLSVIRQKGGRASIKDISTVIRGVSEKTIQRELGALVASGKVKKEGERRWSVYALL